MLLHFFCACECALLLKNHEPTIIAQEPPSAPVAPGDSAPAAASVSQASQVSLDYPMLPSQTSLCHSQMPSQSVLSQASVSQPSSERLGHGQMRYACHKIMTIILTIITKIIVTNIATNIKPNDNDDNNNNFNMI